MNQVKATEVEGDVAVGRHIAMGGDATVQGNATIKKNLKVEGWLDAPNIKGHKHDYAGVDMAMASAKISSDAPYITFHNHNATDFTSRIIEYVPGKLIVENSEFVVNKILGVHGDLIVWEDAIGSNCFINGIIRSSNCCRLPHSASYVVTYGDGGTHHYGIGWDTVSHTARIGACNNNGEWIGSELINGEWKDVNVNFSFKGNVYANNIAMLEMQLQDCLARIEILEAKHPQTT